MEGADELLVAVVGRAGAGKTCLVTHLSLALTPQSAASPPVAAPPPPVPARPDPSVEPAAPQPPPLPPPLIVRQVRAGWAAAAAWIRLHFRAHHGPPFTDRAVPAPRASALPPRSWRVLDVREDALFHTAFVCRPDVVLYVTRLDESRANRLDRMQLVMLGRAFGDRVWSRTLFVLTHGCSLPPAFLTYAEFLRGRRDALWRDMTMVLPPVPRGRGDTSERESGDDACADGAAVGNSGVQREFEERAPRRGGDDEVMHRVEPREVSGTGAGAVVDAAVPSREDCYCDGDRDGDGDGNSGSGGGGDGGGEAEGDGGGEAEGDGDVELFDDPPAPQIVVVELAQSCPRDESGEKVLPDGTAWMPALFSMIDMVVTAAQERDAATAANDGGSEGEAAVSGHVVRGVYEDPSKPKTIQDHIMRLLRRRYWALAAEMILLTLIVKAVTTGDEIRKRRRKRIRARKSDIIVGISDAEYAALTTKDVPRARKSTQGLDEADDLFFGSKKDNANRRGGADSTKSENADAAN